MSTKKTPVKSKLLKLKEWLTVPEAARHLSTIFNEEVSDADILRLSLDNLLKLSVNFVHSTCAKRGKVVSLEDTIWDVFSQNPAVEKSNRENSLKDIKYFNRAEEKAQKKMNDKLQKYLEKDPDKFVPLNKVKKIQKAGLEPIVYLKSLNIDCERFINLEDEVIRIDGVWDLPMIGCERFDIEHEYQMLTGGPEVTLTNLEGAFVEREANHIYQLQKSSNRTECLHDLTAQLEKFKELITSNGTNEEKAKKKEEYLKSIESKNRSDSYYPAGGLPSNSVLVVRTQALLNLQDRLSSKDSTNDATIGTHGEIPFFDKHHSFFAPELKIAVEAWTELYEKDPPKGIPTGGHKTYIQNWLKEKHPNLSKRATERITTVINPNPKGGATPTGNG